MESLPEADRAPDQKALPPGGGPLERLGTNSRDLVQEVRSWVDLRLQLFRSELLDAAETRLNEIALQVGLLIIAALGGFFALVTLALFLGWLLGHPAWGFLVVTVLLFTAAAVLNALHPQFVKLGEPTDDTADDRTAQS